MSLLPSLGCTSFRVYRLAAACSDLERNPGAAPTFLPVVPKGVGRRLLPALIGLRVQEAVVSMDGVAQVVPPLLLA